MRIEHPADGRQLQHGCRVCFTTVSLEKTIEAPAAVKFSEPPAQAAGAPPPPHAPPPPQAQLVNVATYPVSSLVIFRNQQGTFLPGMSSTDEPQYWRMLKVGATRQGENICEGDTVRLCWAVADQTTGFRDFVNDIYGRRRNHLPPELASTVLYPKLPWPRFENIDSSSNGAGVGSNTMVMSTSPGREAIWADIVSRPQLARNPKGTSKYLLQDLTFRIDPVSNNGKGDTDDCLLTNAEDQEGSAPVWSAQYQHSVAGLAGYQAPKQQRLMEKLLLVSIRS